MESDQLSVTEGQKPRPRRTSLLTVLCILTFIGSGLNIISSLTVALFNDLFRTVGLEIAERFDLPGIDLILNAPPVFFWLNTLFFAMSFGGALIMWNLKKTGFHLYAISQILLILSTMYFFELPGPSIPDVIFSGIFIILYSTQLKQMNT